MTEDIARQLELLKQLVRPADGKEFPVDLTAMERMIAEELPEALEKDAPANFPEIYFDFRQEFGRFKEFMLFGDLIGRNVVALGGGFSSGKSSFLNSILGEELLPAGIDPSTSVPTYLVRDDALSAYGINSFSARVSLEPEEIGLLAHGFGRGTGQEVTLGHLMSSLFLSTPALPFSRLALLDTPGYSKADTADYSAKTDESIARTQLNSANYVLWFVQADAGTITEADIAFLKTLKPELPKAVILNKADKLMPDELDEVAEKIRDVLLVKGIEVEAIYTYSSDEPEDYDRDEILACLSRWDTQPPASRFAYNFKVLFTKCRDYYDDQLDEEKKRHSRMSDILAAELEPEARQELQFFDNACTRRITALKERKAALQQLQTAFFTEIKRISDLVHIEMPEPSEIELLEDRRTDIGDVIAACCVNRGLDSLKDRKRREGFETVLANTLAGCGTGLFSAEGTARQRDETADMIFRTMENTQVRINENLSDTVAALAGTLGAILENRRGNQ